ESRPSGTQAAEGTLAARVSGPAAVARQLSAVLTADSLAEALARRSSLGPGESIITPAGEWVGPDWLRVSRGVDHHAGVIEREHRLKALRAEVAAGEDRVRETEAQLAAARQTLEAAEAERDRTQAGIQSAHRE